MVLVMPQSVQICQTYHADSSRDACNEGNDRESFLLAAGVLCETASVTKPSLGGHGEIKQDDHGCAARDEEGFQPFRADVCGGCVSQ